MRLAAVVMEDCRCFTNGVLGTHSGAGEAGTVLRRLCCLDTVNDPDHLSSTCHNSRLRERLKDVLRARLVGRLPWFGYVTGKAKDKLKICQGTPCGPDFFFGTTWGRGSDVLPHDNSGFSASVPDHAIGRPTFEGLKSPFLGSSHTFMSRI